MAKKMMELEDIMTESDRERIQIDGNVITVDTHGMKRKTAMRLLQNIIVYMRVSTAWILRVIHGYHGGTVIKDMIATDLINKRIARKFSPECNQGLTCLEIAAAY